MVRGIWKSIAGGQVGQVLTLDFTHIFWHKIFFILSPTGGMATPAYAVLERQGVSYAISFDSLR